MSIQEIDTIAKAVAYAEQQLDQISDSPKLDGQILLAHVLNKPRSYLYTWPELPLSDVHKQAFDNFLAKRVEGEPIAYLVGYKEFWSLTLKVSPATLIPRPDTEVLVEAVLENHQQESISCLDLGTGTGAIALALASECKHWQINAVDFNDDAVELAKQNAKKHLLTNVSIFQSNWFSNIPAGKKYQIVVSNPPYIDPSDHHLDEGDVRFEPKSALVASNHGLADIERIIIAAKRFLIDGGYLYFEHGFDQASAVQALFLDNEYCNIQTRKDYNGNDRISFACYKFNKKIKILEE